MCLCSYCVSKSGSVLLNGLKMTLYKRTKYGNNSIGGSTVHI